MKAELGDRLVQHRGGVVSRLYLLGQPKRGNRIVPTVRLLQYVGHCKQGRGANGRGSRAQIAVDRRRQRMCPMIFRIAIGCVLPSQKQTPKLHPLIGGVGLVDRSAHVIAGAVVVLGRGRLSRFRNQVINRPVARDMCQRQARGLIRGGRKVICGQKRKVGLPGGRQGKRCLLGVDHNGGISALVSRHRAHRGFWKTGTGA
ncbi:hypothetical protein GALL_391900 [mine drainage metagenome]|uniref:Uncharacterized protein n=1 Tax=mine drainage metagenome TaxID=410659 RepID=A0A1J5Q5V4_9ZZZZ